MKAARLSLLRSGRSALQLVSPEQLEARKRDVRLSIDLLFGIETWDRHGMPQHAFLSADAENQARAALCRLLRSGRVPDEVLNLLGWVFDPNGQGDLKAVLKRRNRRRSRHPDRDYEITRFVDRLRRDGRSYEDATTQVADALRKSEEHIKKIYGKHRSDFDPIPRQRRKSDR